jgi:hypothetical protein
VGGSYDSVAVNDHGPYRDFVFQQSTFGLQKRLSHEVFVHVLLRRVRLATLDGKSKIAICRGNELKYHMPNAGLENCPMKV